MSASGIGPGPQDTVKATADMTSRVREMMDDVRQNPSKQIGMTKEELAQRQKLATAPRSFVSDATRRAFEVKSSTRAQQIMNKGILARQREARNKEVAKKMSILRKFQVGMFAAGIGVAWWIGVEFLLPRYAAVQDRNRCMQIRYERAQQKREERLAERSSAET